ncbi:hypothetical protein CCAN11_2190021 [Capnocytophaga canimorsus]|uniref:Uncharacterized protein n=1 Tax=Capnocytophaga canimorsus TaxID=28188 RepID=A0A0B7IJI9_9FLAO|nr:hypothetical protein CCAN11_2190021 [Capnocytophaga canimorsus]
MSKRDELIEKYAADLKEKVGVTPDLEFLTKVTVGLGPSIYNADSSTVAGSDQSELDRIKQNFLVKKLGLKDSPELDKAIEKCFRAVRQIEQIKISCGGVLLISQTLTKRKRIQQIELQKENRLPKKVAVIF